MNTICDKPITGRRKIAGMLTEVEKQAIELSALGLSDKMIANRLGKSQYTISTQLRDVRRKFDIHNKAEIIQLVNFLKYGIINFEASNPFLKYL